jgi:hypothetical protein
MYIYIHIYIYIYTYIRLDWGLEDDLREVEKERIRHERTKDRLDDLELIGNSNL